RRRTARQRTPSPAAVFTTPERGGKVIRLRADLPRIAGVAAAAAMLATTVVAAVPAHAVDDTATVRADETLTVDTQLPGSFGESGNPTAFPVVMRNPGQVHPSVQLAFLLTPHHGVTAEHFDLAFRDPATGTWQNIELRDQADGSGIAGSTGSV